MHTYWDENNWNHEIVDTIWGCPVGEVSLAIDNSGLIHLSYGHLLPDNGSARGVAYAVRKLSGWHIERFDTTDSLHWGCGNPSIELDNCGQPYISYLAARSPTGSGSDLKYAVKIDTIWYIEMVDTVGKWVGRYNALCIDSEGNPYISYEGEASLKHATKRNGQWYIEKIDTMIADPFFALAGYTSIAVDEMGYVHISYPQQIGNHRCKYAKGLPETGIEIEPNFFLRLQSYPNPFNLKTIIYFALPEDSKVNLKVYNVLGQEIKVLLENFQHLGSHEVIWDGKDNLGKEAPSGVYFLKFNAWEYSKTQKLIKVK